jgi:hypothetical protein
MRANKDSEGKAEHVLSAFRAGLRTVLGHEASRGPRVWKFPMRRSSCSDSICLQLF